MSSSKTRDISPDVIKLIACVGVVVIHMSSYGLELFAVGSSEWLASTFWDSLARFAVPVFFMCTGALMLNPERELGIRQVYKNYFLRILLILLFWSWLYYLFSVAGTWLLIRWHEENFLLNSVWHTLRFEHFFHLYYLQILLLLYAVLPILRVFTRAADEREQRYAVILWLVLGIALPLLRKYPPLSSLGGLWNQAEINMCWSAVGYALLGHVLYSREASRSELKWFVLAFCAGFAIAFGGTVIASTSSGATVLDFMEGMSPGPALMATGLFGSVRCLCIGKQSRPTISRLVSASFCVYLIHYFFVMVIRQLELGLELMHPIIAVPVDTVIIIACSLACWFVLSKIPFVNKHLI